MRAEKEYTVKTKNAFGTEYTIVGMNEDGSDYDGFTYYTASRDEAYAIGQGILDKVTHVSGYRVYENEKCIASGWRVKDGW